MTTQCPIVITTKINPISLIMTLFSQKPPTTQTKAVQNCSNSKTISSKNNSTICKSKSTSSNPHFTSFSTLNRHYKLFNITITSQAIKSRPLLCTMNKDKPETYQLIRTHLLTLPKGLIEKFPKFSLMNYKNHKSRW